MGLNVCVQCGGPVIGYNGIMVTQEHDYVCSKECKELWDISHKRLFDELLNNSDTFGKFMDGDEEIFQKY